MTVRRVHVGEGSIGFLRRRLVGIDDVILFGSLEFDEAQFGFRPVDAVLGFGVTDERVIHIAVIAGLLG